MVDILICDSDDSSSSGLSMLLEKEGYRIHRQCDGKSAVSLVDRYQIKLILMDVNLPDINGIELISRFRKRVDIPVVIISSKNSDVDRMLGFSLGADDYIGKPYNPLEVVAKVKVFLKRCSDLYEEDDNNPSKLCSGGLLLQKAKSSAFLDGEKLNLTRTEYGILECLMRSKGQVMPKRMIYRQVWKEDPCVGCEEIVSMHMYNLRKKIELDVRHPRFIKVIWGEGYKLEDIRQQQ